MSEDRILAVDIMGPINEAIDAAKAAGEPITFGEILYALRVVTTVIVSHIPIDRRQDYALAHLVNQAEMFGVPLVPMEVDIPEKEGMH